MEEEVQSIRVYGADINPKYLKDKPSDSAEQSMMLRAPACVFEPQKTDRQGDFVETSPHIWESNEIKCLYCNLPILCPCGQELVCASEAADIFLMKAQEYSLGVRVVVPSAWNAQNTCTKELDDV